MLGSDNALALDMSDASPGLYSNAHKSLEQAVAKHLARPVWPEARSAVDMSDAKQGLQTVLLWLSSWAKGIIVLLATASFVTRTSTLRCSILDKAVLQAVV